MIVVTTPTGNIGAGVLQGLLDRGAAVRAVVRDPSRLPSQVQGRVEIVEGSHGDPEVVARAFAGAKAVFWLVPPDYRASSVLASYVDFTKPAAEAFISQGVERVVAVSVLGRGSPLAANAGVLTASLAMGDLIAKTAVGLRTLALPQFMNNFLGQVGAIKSQGAFFDMVDGDNKFPTIATRDTVAAAVDLLLDESWTGQGDVSLRGPEDLSFNDMAGILTEVLERPIRYQQVPGEAFKAGLVANGLSEAMAQGVFDMRVAKDRGMDDFEPRTPQSTTPTTFRQWATEVLKPAVLA
jgi:uncharacterized protein YbjT (DUF2867 family)